MTAMARFDLTMDTADKEVVARAAALMGTTMAAFVRIAAKEKASELLERQARLVMSTRDFDSFAQALDGAFAPNAALQKALGAARDTQRV